METDGIQPEAWLLEDIVEQSKQIGSIKNLDNFQKACMSLARNGVVIQDFSKVIEKEQGPVFEWPFSGIAEPRQRSPGFKNR